MVERPRPRPGTIRALVLEQLEAKTPRHLIPEATGLTNDQVSNTIPRLYRRYIDKPSEEEINEQRRRSISVSRRSNKGTKVHIVFEQLQQGVPREKIPGVTGLTMGEVGRAVAQLRRTERAKKLSPSEQREQMIASIRTAKKSLWPYIGEYAEMGMTPRQIEIAARLEKGLVFSRDKIMYTVGKARNRAHHIPKRSEEENTYVIRVANMSGEEVEQGVRLLLKIKNVLIEGNLNHVPQRLSDWLVLVEVYKRTADSPKELGEYLLSLDSDKRSELKKAIKAIINDRKERKRGLTLKERVAEVREFTNSPEEIAAVLKVDLDTIRAVLVEIYREEKLSIPKKGVVVEFGEDGSLIPDTKESYERRRISREMVVQQRK